MYIDEAELVLSKARTGYPVAPRSISRAMTTLDSTELKKYFCQNCSAYCTDRVGSILETRQLCPRCSEYAL